MKELICITCPRGCRLSVDDNLNVTGNSCPRGVVYAKNELTHPVRMVTTTVKIISELEMRLPVKTSVAIDKNLMFKVVEELDKIEVKAPIRIGDVVIKNIFGSGVDILATKNIGK